MLIRNCFGLLLLLAALPVWAQEEPSEPVPPAVNAAATEDRMVTPAAVSIEGMSLAFVSEERKNLMRVGLTVGGFFDDNALSPAAAVVSDESYSIAPNILLNQARGRLEWDLSYRPAFLFYQHYTELNQSDHKLAVDFSYRLSPHVTMKLRDDFERGQIATGFFSVDGSGTFLSGLQGANNSIIAPLADRLDNLASAELTYQFSPGSMIGVNGLSRELHYLDRSQLPGLYDSSTRQASAFYGHRISHKHYVGVGYQFQDLLSLPNQSDAHAHTAFLFYTVYLQSRLTLSFFGGPQYALTSGTAVLSGHKFSPSAGVTLTWQGQHSSFASQFTRRITDGGGLQGAVQSNDVNGTIRHGLTRSLTMGLGSDYFTNSIVNGTQFTAIRGHTISGTASLDIALSPHLSAGLSYTRLHQTYSGIQALSGAADRNRASVVISYQFDRPLGK